MIESVEKTPVWGSVLSDLHLFTNRSTAHNHLDEIHETAAASDLFIFNGDTFDFAWSKHRGYEKSVAAAIEWITDLATAHPHCSFVFLLGNHDGIALFKEALGQLAESLSNLHWEPYHVQLGEKVFLHGDVFHAGTTPEHLETYREQWDKPHKKHRRFAGRMYWMAAHVGIPNVLIRFIPRKRCARRILSYLRETLGGSEQEVREIYFGHTHRSFEDYEYRNRTFHNTGAALKRIRLSILQFEVDGGASLQFSNGSELEIPGA